MSVAKDEDLGASEKEVRIPPENAASQSAPAAFAFDMAVLSHPGTERNDNEDSCVSHRENDQCGLLAVADGVSSYDGGEVAS